MVHYFRFCFFVFVLHQTCAASDPVQWSVAEGGNGHWYRAEPVFLTWNDAQSAASKIGAHLATAKDEAENFFIQQVRDQQMDFGGAWIGQDPSAKVVHNGSVIDFPCHPSSNLPCVCHVPGDKSHCRFVDEHNDPNALKKKSAPKPVNKIHQAFFHGMGTM